MIILDLSLFTLEDILKFDKNFFPYPWSLEDWNKISQKQNEYYFKGLKQEGCLMGFILVSKNSLNDFWHLLKIVVEPSARRQGAAQMLFDIFLEDHRGDKIMLEVAVHNESAISLYKKMGFRIIHTQKKFYSDGSDAHIMQLN